MRILAGPATDPPGGSSAVHLGPSTPRPGPFRSRSLRLRPATLIWHVQRPRTAWNPPLFDVDRAEPRSTPDGARVRSFGAGGRLVLPTGRLVVGTFGQRPLVGASATGQAPSKPLRRAPVAGPHPQFVERGACGDHRSSAVEGTGQPRPPDPGRARVPGGRPGHASRRE